MMSKIRQNWKPRAFQWLSTPLNMAFKTLYVLAPSCLCFMYTDFLGNHWTQQGLCQSKKGQTCLCLCLESTPAPQLCLTPLRLWYYCRLLHKSGNEVSVQTLPHWKVVPFNNSMLSSYLIIHYYITIFYLSSKHVEIWYLSCHEYFSMLLYNLHNYNSLSVYL